MQLRTESTVPSLDSQALVHFRHVDGSTKLDEFSQKVLGRGGYFGLLIDQNCYSGIQDRTKKINYLSK